MNKTIFTLAAALLTTVGAAAVTVPFSSKIAENYEFVDGWTQINNSRRGKSFTYDRETGDGQGVYHPYDSDNAADTWMISPNLELTAGTEYTITFETKTRDTDSEKFEAYIATGNTISDLKAGTQLMRNTAYAHSSDFETQTVYFTPETSGDYYFGMHCFSDANSYDFYFHSFSITDGSDGGGEGGEGGEVTTPSDGKPLTYVADFSAEDVRAEWSAVNGPENGSDATWTFNSFNNTFTFDPGEGIKEDAYLISPLLDLNGGNAFSVRLEGSVYGKLQLGLMTDKDDLSTFKSFTTVETEEYGYNAKLPFAVETPGDYYLAIHACNDVATLMGYRINKVTVMQDAPVPAPVNDLAVVADGTDELLVSLSWTMPSLDNYGNKLTGKLSYELYRNGVSVKTGEAYAGEFTATTDEPAEAGVYEYYVTVKNANGADEATPEAVSAGYVGKPVAELSSGKWELDFSSRDAITLTTVEDSDRDGTTFVYTTGYGYYDKYYEVARENYADEIDDYFCSPYLSLAPGYYRLTVTSKSPANAFAFGTVANRHAQAETFTSLLSVAAGEVTETGQQFSTIFVVEETADYALAVHGFGPGDSNNTALRINGLAIESVERVAKAPVNLTVADSGDDAAKAVVSWRNPALDNAGLELTDSDVISAVIKLNGSEVKRSDNFTREQECSVEIEVSEAAEVEVSVELLLNGNGSEESTATVLSFLGEARQVPYVVTDFTSWTTLTTGWNWYTWEKTDNNALTCDAELSFEDAHALSEFVELKSGKSYTVEVIMTNTHKSDDCELALNISGSLKKENLSKMTEIGRFTTEANTTEPKTHTLTIKTADVMPGKYAFGLQTLSTGKPTITSFSIKEQISDAISETIAPVRNADNACYDLQGRHVTSPRPGQILIRNGAKILVR